MDLKDNAVLKQLQEQLQEENRVKDLEDIQVGDIIYYNLDVDDGLHPKAGGYNNRLKYIVVAGSKIDKSKICAVLINSNNNYSQDADWQNEQYLIRQQDYPGVIDYDSWIDCSDLKIIQTRKIQGKSAEKRGHLNQFDLSNVMNHLKNNDFIDNHTRKEFGIDKFED